MKWADRFGRHADGRVRDLRPSGPDDLYDQRRRSGAASCCGAAAGCSDTIDFDALPQYWAEADDKVSIEVDGRTENHYLSRVEFDLTGGPMRCRTRTVATGGLGRRSS